MGFEPQCGWQSAAAADADVKGQVELNGTGPRLRTHTFFVPVCEVPHSERKEMEIAKVEAQTRCVKHLSCSYAQGHEERKQTHRCYWYHG